MDRVMTRSARFLAIGGVASIVFGATVLLWPGISLLAMTMLFGAFSFVYGIYGVAAGLTLAARKSTEWVPFVVGGVGGVLIGAVTFLVPAITELALAYLIAAWAIMVGTLEIVAAVDVRDEIKGAAWLGIGGALSVVFGVIVAFRPGSGLLAILWLVGVYAIAAGVMRLIGAHRIHQLQNEAKRTFGAMQPSGL